MFLLQPKPNSWQFAPYFHFAEPYPRGGLVYADGEPTDDDLADAAEALRTAEIESAQPADELDQEHLSPSTFDTVSELTPLEVLQSMQLTQSDLETMSIDEVRAVANVLDVPDRGTITAKAELIREVLRRL